MCALKKKKEKKSKENAPATDGIMITVPTLPFQTELCECLKHYAF